MKTVDSHFGPECIICSLGAYQVRTPPFPGLCSYVRIVRIVGDGLDHEQVFWDREEWLESGEDVMGAIMGAIKSIMNGTYIRVPK